MKMSLSQQKDSSEELVRMYSGGRLKKVSEKWERLREDFQEYTDKASASPWGHIKVCKHSISRCANYKIEIRKFSRNGWSNPSSLRL